MEKTTLGAGARWAACSRLLLLCVLSNCATTHDKSQCAARSPDGSCLGPAAVPEPAFLPEVIEWSELQRLMSKHMLPSVPYIVRNSPQQQWLKTSNGLWTPARMLQATSALDSEAGSTIVNLKSQQTSNTFTHHYQSTEAGASHYSSSAHSVTATSLHEALRLIWPAATDTSTASTYYYLSPDMQSMPPEMLPFDPDTLLQFIPEGCLSDDTRHFLAPAEPCRGLASNMWIGQTGGVSAAIHYDLQHNLFVMASGVKRFTLLHPSQHHHLRLHPRWHGSQRQAQNCQPNPTPMLQVELHEGDALYIPPLWFHFVESLSAGVAANFWTDSRESDLWLQLTNRSAADEVTTGNWASLLDQSEQGVSSRVRAVLSQARSVARLMLLLVNVESKSVVAAVTARQDAKFDGNALLQNSVETHREQIIATCKAEGERFHEDIELAARLSSKTRETLVGYARALDALDMGARSLLVAEWVDEFSAFAVWSAGFTASTQHMYSGTFVQACLIY